MYLAHVNILIIAMSLIASFFSCSLDAMTAIQPKSILPMQTRQSTLQNRPTRLREGGSSLSQITTTPYLAKQYFPDIQPLCKEGEIFIKEQGTSFGVCFSLEAAQISTTLSNMIKDLSGKEDQDIAITMKGNQESIILPFNIVIIKDTLDVIKIYADAKSQDQSEKRIQHLIKNVIGDYSAQRLIDMTNCISFLDCPQNLLNICLDEIKTKHQGDLEAIIANTKLNPDLRKYFILEPTIHYVTSLLQKKNLLAQKKILRNYSDGGHSTSSVGLNWNGTKTIEGLASSFVIRDASGKQLIDKQVLFNVSVVAMSPDGTKAIVGGHMSELKLYNADTGAQIYDLVGYNQSERIFSIAFSQDGTKIVSGGYFRGPGRSPEHSIQVWDVATGTQLAGMSSMATSVLFNSNGTKIISGHSGGGHFSGVIKLWDLTNTPPTSRQFDGFGHTIYSVVLSPDNAKVLYIGRNHSDIVKVSLLNINNGTSHELAQGNAKEKNSLFNCIPLKAFFIHDDKTIVIGEVHGIRILNIDDNYNISANTFVEMGGTQNPLSSMAVSIDGRKIVCGYRTESQGDYPAFTEFTFWTGEDETIINQLKNTTFAQIKLISTLCSELKEQGFVKKLKPADAETFQRLPVSMQQTLSDIFWPPQTLPKG